MRQILTAIRSLLADLGTPSERDESAYQWGLIGTAHAVLGDALVGLCAALLPITEADAMVMVPALYLILKEARDVRKGGELVDSLIDACFVALGGARSMFPAVAGQDTFPVAVLVAAFGGAVIRSAFNPQ